jgi:hypothetical protein
MKRLVAVILVALCAWACAGEPRGLPDFARATAERYLDAWQASRWDTIYKLEGQGPESDPVLHKALTDSLEFYVINEIRYADSSVACAVTLRWRTTGGTYSETGELYLERQHTDWFIKGFRSF